MSTVDYDIFGVNDDIFGVNDDIFGSQLAALVFLVKSLISTQRNSGSSFLCERAL
jgi:hypothetical protein